MSLHYFVFTIVLTPERGLGDGNGWGRVPAPIALLLKIPVFRSNSILPLRGQKPRPASR
ncbi:hypothetical protein SBBP1_380031 [Burkholderiales bacterium]|nr:hypothetical protein SBBP1_380031 [Burkholderiales bacterium]